MQNTEDRNKFFKSIDLTDDQILAYEHINEQGNTAKEIATNSNRAVHALYRLLSDLEKRGLIRKIDKRPARYVRLAVNNGLTAAYLEHTRNISKLLSISLQNSNVGDMPELLMGKKALYDLYPILANKSKESIKLYTIGVAFSDEFVKVQQAAIDRGVTIQHVIQEKKALNYHVLHTWKRLGITIRLLPRPRGFYLMIFDKKTVVMTFSSELDTNERMSIVIENVHTTALFMNMFESIWKESIEF